MLKRKTAGKFWIFYFLFLLVSTLLFFLFVPSTLQDHFVKKSVDKLLLTAEELIEYPEVYACSFRESPSTRNTRRLLNSLDEINGTETWLVNEDGRVMLNSQHDYPLAQAAQIPDFITRICSRSCWVIGDFSGMLPSEALSVIVPVTVTPHTTDYVILHYPMARLNASIRDLSEIFFFILLLIFVISLIFPIAFYIFFQRPLNQILQISNDFAGGNLYALPSKSTETEEFSAIKSNLSFLAEELQQSGENQKKFISNISHDFRSPLTSIKGYAEAMLDGTAPAEARDKYLNIIRTEAERLTSLTQNILITNSLQENGTFLEKSVFDINTVLQLCISSMEIQCRKKDLHIISDLPFYPQPVYADKEKIQQVVYNLLDNAIKFSEPHSSIQISTTQKKRYVFVSVKDHGEGIPSEEIPRIWNRFYKADTSRNRDKTGTGLGLSIVREIIRAHGQNINVISTKGVGSEFIFTLDKAD